VDSVATFDISPPVVDSHISPPVVDPHTSYTQSKESTTHYDISPPVVDPHISPPVVDPHTSPPVVHEPNVLVRVGLFPLYLLGNRSLQ
jgi:hypothetical protein